MKVIIIGGRGTPACIAEQMVEAHDDYGMDIEVLGLALDDHSMGDSVYGQPILCGIRELHEKYGKFKDVYYVYSLYRGDVMEERTELLYSLNIPIEKFCNFAFPTVRVSKSARMGFGNIVLEGSSIGTCARLGNFNTLFGARVGHDSEVGNNNFFSGGSKVGGCCRIGDMNFFGMDSLLSSSISVGNRNYVGAACCVSRKLKDNRMLYHAGTKKHPLTLAELKQDMFPTCRSDKNASAMCRFQEDKDKH